MRACNTRMNMRAAAHKCASNSGREVLPCRCRTRAVQVHAALFEPPPFQPKKLSVQYLAGARPPNSLSAPLSRRYTLTHNDVTGALNLSIGSDYNKQQIQGFYTRILRDEITAEWYITSGAAAPAELHIYCHVSGEERWLAPPQLRNFIFRREMTLVLDTFYYADREFLKSFPDLLKAKVYVHFQSDVQDLDLREYWGTLGDRRSWRRMPRGVLARLKLLLFGFPAVPHQRPRTSLTWQQQQRQQQQLEGVQLMPAVTAAAVTAGQEDAVQAQQQQNQQQHNQQHQQHWHLSAEAAVEQTRPVALSLQEQRKLHPQERLAGQQQQQLQQDSLMVVGKSSGSSKSNGSSRESDEQEGHSHLQAAQELLQQQELQAEQSAPDLAAAVILADKVPQPTSNGSGMRSSGDEASSAVAAEDGHISSAGNGTVHNAGSNGSNGSNSSGCFGSNRTEHAGPVPTECERQQDLKQPALVSSVAGQLPQQQQQQQVVQQREKVLAFTDPSDVFQEYGYWLRPGGRQRSGHNSNGALLPVVALDASVATFQSVLQQKTSTGMCSAVVAAAAVHNGSSYPGNDSSRALAQQ